MDYWRPTAKQCEFLSAPEDEVLYGGAAGGGKSDALVVDALGLQQGAISNPNYRALILRQTFPQLRKLLDRTMALYPRVVPGAEFYDRPWSEWRMPSGAKIIFASCERDIDVQNFQGHEFQWIGIDELGHYGSPYVWEYLTSRLRSSDPTLKCYMRATCNPGPKWIQERWNIPDSGEDSAGTISVTLGDGRTVMRRLRFIQALLRDNPFLAEDGAYEAQLQRLPMAERAALLEGRWGVVDVPGAIYRDVLNEAREQKRITGVPYDRASVVHTYWDIGISDATAIWCAQRVGREWHLIDYYEERGKTAVDAAHWLKSSGYAYGEHYLPHDAAARERGTGVTYQEVLQGHGVQTRITPRLGIEEGISAARMIFSQCWFDERRCEAGLRALQFYRREWKDRQGQYTQPVHDQHSHGADAFRYFAVASRLDAVEFRDGMKLPSLDKMYPDWAAGFPVRR
ncbi:MAG TPA: terminase family protein [Steroidobacteraceae bacterium]|nr:terminase family protein [Steroidobacteraceae bacterium]